MRRIALSFVVLLTACASSADETVDVEPGTGGARVDAGSGGAIGAGGSRVDAGKGGGGSANTGGSVSTGGSSNTGGSGNTGGSSNTGGSTGTGGSIPPGDAGADCPGAPELTPGVFRNITPAALDFTGTYGSAHVDIDPTNHCTLYAAADQRGLWKTTDAGSNWTRLGTPPSSPNYGTTANYLDSPIRIAVDPNDGKHIYATQGVRGQTLGFWVSTDGGATWAMPAGFISIASTINTRDMTQMSVDPTDFKHVIVGSHSGWNGSPAGVLETKDGGATFIAHPAMSTWGTGSIGLHFLYSPELGIGDKNTWLVATDGNGFWRTTDGAATWTQVETWGCPHGGNSIYYTKAGVLYAGGYQYPVRSTDNGVTWQQVKTGLAYAYYYTVQGDGKTLYTLKSYADNGAKYNVPYNVSAETDGATWTVYQGGAQNFDNGPFMMQFDKVNRIMYSANWNAGIWALKVLP